MSLTRRTFHHLVEILSYSPDPKEVEDSLRTAVWNYRPEDRVLIHTEIKVLTEDEPFGVSENDVT